MKIERLTDIMVALDAAITEQKENISRCTVEMFLSQQGRLFGLEQAKDIAYRILMDISGEEDDFGK